MRLKPLEFLTVLALSAGLSWAQNVSSSVKGMVVDTSKAAIPRADCTLTDQATGRALTVASLDDGAFTFPSVLAGTYTLNIQAKGFKAMTITDIAVTGSEIRTLGKVAMQLGQLKEVITVNAEAAVVAVQLATGEKSGLINGNQMNDLALKGRDFWALLATLPGVVDDGSQSRETITGNSNHATYINGGGASSKNYSVDGIYSLNSSNATTVVQPNMDSIDEVMVLTTNYRAEYGRMSSGVISVVTKGGSRDFHGSGWSYFRNEALNANNFFANSAGTPKGKYRYKIFGYSIGGPVYIPRIFNTGRNKLFFFFSQEFDPITTDYGSQYVNTPTALERKGDFSQSRDASGNLIIIKDPVTQLPYPGNVVPAAAINKAGQSILNFFPLPNYTDPNPSRLYYSNYRSSWSASEPLSNAVVRVDYNPLSSLNAYYRFVRNTQNTEAPWGSWRIGNNYLLTPDSFRQPGVSHMMQATKTFSPTFVNEARFGYIDQFLNSFFADPSKVVRSNLSNVPQMFPKTDSPDYMPDLNFGSQPASTIAVSLGPNPWPWEWKQYTFADNVIKVWAGHTLKAGVNLDFQTYVGASVRTDWRGQFNFGRNTSNPFDTNDGFSNALLGVFNTYAEVNKRIPENFNLKILEAYVQDNWRVSKRLTLDFGLRTMSQPPEYDQNNVLSHLDPAYYQASAVPKMYVPTMSGGQRVGQDPTTGAVVPAALIGLFVPGTGNPANGMKVGGVDGYPRGLLTRPFMSLAPRIGFAYDLFGNGKTALRGGFGVFYDTPTGNAVDNSSGNPPVAYAPIQYYGNLATMASNTGLLGPTGISSQAAIGQKVALPRTMNFSLGIQHQVAGNTVVEASYVGSLARHLLLARDINEIPMYARFAAANVDPTTGKALPDNFLRPYLGYGSVTVNEFSGTSNYHALQTSLNRRFTKGLQASVSYTFSRVLGITSRSGYFNDRQWNYGLLGQDRTNVFVASYSYDLPKIGAKTGFKPASWILDHWILSGITSFVSGTPYTPSESLADGADLTGSSESARITVVGNPYLPKSQRTFLQNFNVAAFARTPLRSFGNAGIGMLRGPGQNNWDVSLGKRFPLWGEKRFLQIRGEAFNAWNHTQFSSVDGTLRFDATGKQLSTTVGNYNGARSPRIIELSARINF